MVILSLFRKDKNGSHSGSRFFDSLSNIRVLFKSSITTGCISLLLQKIQVMDEFDYSAIFLAATP